MGTATWGALLLATLAAMLIIGVPGLLIGVALRLRGLWLAATTPVLGISAITIASIWAGASGVWWASWTVLVTAGVIGALGRALTAVTHRSVTPTPPLSGRKWAAPVGVGLGIVLLSIRMVSAIGAPDWFDQAGDNVFHLNAVRWILDHGNASPFDVMQWFDRLANVSIYPTAWHATVALVCDLSGTPIPVASNAVLFVVGCVVWPLGAVLLTRTLFGTRPALLITAGAISAGFATYPLLLIPYMGTYPLVLSIAMIPPVLAATASLTGTARDRISRPASSAVIGIAVVGITFAHPSATIMWAALTIPLVLGGLWRLGHGRRDRRNRAILLGVLYAVGVFTLFVFVRPGFTQPNSARSSTGQAIGEVLTGAFAGLSIPLVLSALTLVGVVVALRAREVTGWSAVGMWVVASLIYMAAVSNDEFVHLLIGGPWYSDATRVAAFTPIAILPLAARGAEWAWARASGLVAFSAHPARQRIAEVTAVALLAAVMVQSAAARGTTEFTRAMFTPTDNVLTSPIPVSRDDRALLARIPSHVPADAVIAGDPWTGASFAYALTGRRALVPHMLAPITGQTKVLLDGISTSAPDGPACLAARKLGVGWVLELHGGKTLPNRPHYAGLRELADSPNMQLVVRVGESSLYKIVGCNEG